MADLRVRYKTQWLEAIGDAAGRIWTRALLTGRSDHGADEIAHVSEHGAVRTAKRIVATSWVLVPGTSAASAYADEDAFGTRFTLDVPRSGVITSAMAIDEDDEDLDVNLFLFREDITSGTDNSAYAPSTSDLLKLEAIINLDLRYGVSGATLGYNPGLVVPYIAPAGLLWVQAVARGALNLAAGKRWFVALRIVADD